MVNKVPGQVTGLDQRKRQRPVVEHWWLLVQGTIQYGLKTLPMSRKNSSEDNFPSTWGTRITLGVENERAKRLFHAKSRRVLGQMHLSLWSV